VWRRVKSVRGTPIWPNRTLQSIVAWPVLVAGPSRPSNEIGNTVISTKWRKKFGTSFSTPDDHGSASVIFHVSVFSPPNLTPPPFVALVVAPAPDPLPFFLAWLPSPSPVLSATTGRRAWGARSGVHHRSANLATPPLFPLIRIDIRFPSLASHRRHRLGFERTLVATHGLRRRRPLFISHEPGRLHRLRSCHHTRRRPPGRQCCPIVCPPAAPASKAVFHGAYREHPQTPVKGADAASGALGPQLQRGQ
jgi:hypothetical protein